MPRERKEAEMRVAQAHPRRYHLPFPARPLRNPPPPRPPLRPTPPPHRPQMAEQEREATQRELAAPRGDAGAASDARRARLALGLAEAKRERGDLALVQGVQRRAAEAAAAGRASLPEMLARGRAALDEAAALLASLQGGRCWVLPEASNEAMARPGRVAKQ